MTMRVRALNERGKTPMTTAAEWNQRHPPGTTVRLKIKGTSGSDAYLTVKTRAAAFTLSTGKAVVGLEGINGAKALADVEAVPTPVSGSGVGQQAGPSPSYPGSYPGMSPLLDAHLLMLQRVLHDWRSMIGSGYRSEAQMRLHAEATALLRRHSGMKP